MIKQTIMNEKEITTVENEAQVQLSDIELDDRKALIILINSAHIGQKAGAYSISEAELISRAIRHFSGLIVSSAENS